MKFYLDNYGELLTEKQFKKQFSTKEIIFYMILNEGFQNDFIKICSTCSESSTIKDAVNRLIQEIQEDEGLLSKYCEYFEVERKEIDDDEIIEELKENKKERKK